MPDSALPRFDRRIGRRDVTSWNSRAGQRLENRHRSLADRVGDRRALLATLAVGGAVAAAATFGVTRIYDAVTDRDGISSLDRPALALAKRLRSPAANGAAAAIARGFGPIGMPLLALGAGAAISARHRDASPLLLVAAAGVGSLGMTLTGKRLIRRNRPRRSDAIPPFERSPSFPSGHTLNATTVLGILAYLLALGQRRNSAQAATITAASATAVVVGLSRVLLGAHWLTDVVVGWTSGAGWLSLVVTSHRLYLTTHDERDAGVGAGRPAA